VLRRVGYCCYDLCDILLFFFFFAVGILVIFLFWLGLSVFCDLIFGFNV